MSGALMFTLDKVTRRLIFPLFWEIFEKSAKKIRQTSHQEKIS